MDGKGGVGAEQMRQGNGTLVVCPCGLLGAGSEAAAVWGPLPVVVAAGGPRGAVARVVALPVLLSCLYRPDSRGLLGRSGAWPSMLRPGRCAVAHQPRPGGLVLWVDEDGSGSARVARCYCHSR